MVTFSSKNKNVAYTLSLTNLNLGLIESGKSCAAGPSIQESCPTQSSEGVDLSYFAFLANNF